MNESIRYSVDAEGVALLVLDVPGRPMNLLTPDLLAALEACVDRVARDAAVRGAVVTSAKPGLLAGADLKELVNVFDAGLRHEDFSRYARSFSKAFRRLETCGKPFVAAINGTALGGGLELCLARLGQRDAVGVFAPMRPTNSVQAVGMVAPAEATY